MKRLILKSGFLNAIVPSRPLVTAEEKGRSRVEAKLLSYS